MAANERWVAYTAKGGTTQAFVNMCQVTLIVPISAGGTVLWLADGKEIMASEAPLHFLGATIRTGRGSPPSAPPPSP